MDSPDQVKLSKLEAENKIFRQMLWNLHPCLGKYCDDGELQCGACGMDFIRDSAQLLKKLEKERLLRNFQKWADTGRI